MEGDLWGCGSLSGGGIGRSDEMIVRFFALDHPTGGVNGFRSFYFVLTQSRAKVKAVIFL